MRRNPYVVDLGTVDGVVDTLPRQRPEHRPDIDLRYVTLGPADVDIGFAGRHQSDDPLHRRIASLSTGEKVVVTDRHVRTGEGHSIGKLANKTDLKTSAAVTGSVSVIMVRTRDRTPAEYRTGVKVDRWETVLMELVLRETRP